MTFIMLAIEHFYKLVIEGEIMQFTCFSAIDAIYISAYTYL